METIEAKESHAFPVNVRCEGGKYIDLCLETDNVVILPSQQSITSLCEVYLQEWIIQQQISLNTFRDIMTNGLPYIRVSLITTEICERCSFG